MTRISPVATVGEKNGLANFLERSPIITLATAVVTISGVIYGIVNYVASQKIDGLKLEYEQRANALKLNYDKEYDAKMRLLEEERSRINFAIKNESFFLDTASIVVDDIRLSDNYKLFRSANFAVPSNIVDSRWSWRESNEAELLTDTLGAGFLDSMLSGEDSAKQTEALQKLKLSKLSLFESTDSIDAMMQGHHATLKARCLFQSFTKKDLDAILEPRGMEEHYRRLFAGQYEIFLIDLGGTAEQISLNDDRFVIQGHTDLETGSGGQIRLYFLRIGVRTNDRIFHFGYMVPTGDNRQDVRMAMSMISGFKIIK